MERDSGQYLVCSVAGEQYRSFIPAPLPPEPALEFSGDLLARMDSANRALGRLDGIMDVLPDMQLFLYQYVRKEALLSSQIEGTQSSFSDLLLYEMHEAPGVPLDDVEEVSSYIAAMNHGLQRLQEGFPLSLRLIREIHAILLNTGRGAQKEPGEFRRSQNWLGGSRPGNAVFVPPPPEQLMVCLHAFEQFLHADTHSQPVLVKAALAHVQFETIHPFLDGNGRLGRLLITLLLCHDRALQQPLLYLSLYFKTHLSAYYDHLQQVRQRGDWEAWLGFFMRGVEETAEQAVRTARDMLALFQQDAERIKGIGRIAASCLQLHQLLQQTPILNIASATESLQINRTSISRCFSQLQALGIVRELTGNQRNRYYIYHAYVALLGEGTNPL